MWTYRVGTEVVGGERQFGIIEFFTLEDGSVAWSDFVEPYGDTVEELIRVIGAMAGAMNKPVWDMDKREDYKSGVGNV